MLLSISRKKNELMEYYTFLKLWS